MNKQLIYNSEDYYYEHIDAEDGMPIFDKSQLAYMEEHCLPYSYVGEQYCHWMAEDDLETIYIELDEDKRKTESRRFAKVKIYGTLGLWDGKHDIMPEEEDYFEDAIKRCLGRDIESFEIYKSGDWTLYIDAHHHDGTNHFKITCYI